MMKTKLKFFFDALIPKVGRANLRQREFTFRKVFAICLLTMVAQLGVAVTPDGNVWTYDLNGWHRIPVIPIFKNGEQVRNSSGSLVSIVSDFDSSNNSSINSLDYRWAITGEISSEEAGETAKEWIYRIHNNAGEIYVSDNNQTLSLLNLFVGDKVQIFFWGSDNRTKCPEVTSTNTNITSISPDDKRLTSGQEVTMNSNGSMDFRIRNGIFITKVVITHANTAPRVVFDDSRNSNSDSYSTRLALRNFVEPTVSVYPSNATIDYRVYTWDNVNNTTIATSSDKEVAVMNANPTYKSDVLFKNIGWCKVTATITVGGSSYSDSYYVWVWDDLANYELQNSGTRYCLNQIGVLSNRYVTAVGGMEMTFGNVSNNSTIVEKVTVGGTDHFVAYTPANNGWWDRYPYDAGAWPSQGTYYSFEAKAAGKLKFGGYKTSEGGKVIIVRTTVVVLKK
jgi:hypothetical protein